MLTLGTIAISAGIITMITMANPIASLALMITGTVMIAIGIAFSIRSEKTILPDERIRKLSTRGLAWSWLTTFFVIGLLVWNDLFAFIPFTVQHTLSIIYATMIISAYAFQRTLYQRGDIE
jgi:hypothetical protein